MDISYSICTDTPTHDVAHARIAKPVTPVHMTPYKPQPTSVHATERTIVFFIIPVYLQSVQVHSVNWLKEVDECLGEGRSLALFYS
jgi:hypothetical protein